MTTKKKEEELGGEKGEQRGAEFLFQLTLELCRLRAVTLLLPLISASSDGRT